MWSASGHMGPGSREVWFESHQDSGAVGVGEVTQGACKRGKRWGPTATKALKVTQGERSPSGEGKERQAEWQECSGVGRLGGSVQGQMCSGCPRKGLGSAPRVLEQVGIAMLLTG